jgi:hypothetical protein
MKAGSIYSELKEADMTDIDKKINALLIAEGYTASGSNKFEGIKINGFTDINTLEYRRGERERVVITTHAPQKKSA